MREEWDGSRTGPEWVLKGRWGRRHRWTGAGHPRCRPSRRLCTGWVPGVTSRSTGGGREARETHPSRVVGGTHGRWTRADDSRHSPNKSDPPESRRPYSAHLPASLTLPGLGSVVGEEGAGGHGRRSGGWSPWVVGEGGDGRRDV